VLLHPVCPHPNHVLHLLPVACNPPAPRYYPISAISGVVSSIVVMLSYTADVLQPQERTAGFGLVVAAFALGFMAGPQLAQVVTPVQAAWIAFGCCIAAIVLTALFVPESLPPSVAAASGEGGRWRGRQLQDTCTFEQTWCVIPVGGLLFCISLQQPHLMTCAVSSCSRPLTACSCCSSCCPSSRCRCC
jgi:MFS family permease